MRRRWPRRCALAAVLAVGVLLCPAPGMAQGRRLYFELEYTAAIRDIPGSARQVRVWIPYPQSDTHQRIFSLKVESPYPTYVHRDPEYGNRFLYLEVDHPNGEEIQIKYTLVAERSEVISNINLDEIGEYIPGMYPEADRYLRSNFDPSVNRRQIRDILREVLPGKSSYLDKVRAIYDYVYDNMEYSKEIPGYGSGDVSRACRVRAGNCIDFHSLFVALATEAGIPSREVANIDLPFEDGIPNYCEGSYHCNVEVFLPGYGWFPLDVSHAKKGRGSKEFYFGSLDNLRLRLGHGRNLLLQPPQQGPRLTRLLHEPYVEVDGQVHDAVEVSVLASAYDPARYRRTRELIGAGEEAIPFVGTDINGERFDLSEYLGRVPIFINFFTTWCGRCIWETEEINDAYHEFTDILFLRVNFMERKEKATGFAREHRIPHTVLLDEDGEICNLYGVKYVPTNVLIDRRGVVAFSGGFFTGEDLRRRLAQLSRLGGNEER